MQWVRLWVLTKNSQDGNCCPDPWAVPAWWPTQNGTERPGTRVELLRSINSLVFTSSCFWRAFVCLICQYESVLWWQVLLTHWSLPHEMIITDTTHGMLRNEVRSSNGDSQLRPRIKWRPHQIKAVWPLFVVNSASLRFIPKNKMENRLWQAYIDQIEDLFRNGNWNVQFEPGGCFGAMQDFNSQTSCITSKPVWLYRCASGNATTVIM